MASSDAEWLRAALEASGTGTFRWDTRANVVWLDRWMTRLFGTSFTEEPKAAGEFLERVHPLDRAGVMRAVERCAQSGGPFDVEYRIVRPDGGIGWLHARGQTLAGADGKPESITGICADVTDRRAQHDQLRTMAETMPQLVWTTTADGYHDYFNEHWYQYTGMPRPHEPDGELNVPQGLNWTEYLHPEDRDRTLLRWRHSMATGDPYDVEYRFRQAATGKHRWFIGRALPHRDASGRIVRWFGTSTDIEAQVQSAEYERHLQRSASRLAAAATPREVAE
ncbi:MAG TPA: PAS domain-containing protein, partial [Longimicrobium sp.]